MSFQKKVMILSDIKSQKGVGVLRFTTDNGTTNCTVSLHGLDNETTNIIFKINGDFYDIIAKDGDVLPLDIPIIPDVIDCVVTINNAPVLYGSTGMNKYKCYNIMTEYKRYCNRNTITKIQSQNDDKEIINETNQSGIDDDILPQKDEPLAYIGDNYFRSIKPQIEEMFICFPRDTTLENIIPNSKWVHILQDDEEYAVGIIYELDEEKYLAYGIPKDKKSAPPNDLKDVCDWLPLSLDDVDGKGYYIIYQDAKNGQTQKIPEQ